MYTSSSPRGRPVPPRAARAGFTLVELATVFVIFVLLCMVLFPVFIRARYRIPNRRQAPYNPQKQLGLAFLQYLQDNDERFPPGVSYAYPVDRQGREVRSRGRFARSWGPSRRIDADLTLPGLLSPYTKSADVFRRREQKWTLFGERTVYARHTPGYLYNDLLTGERQADLSGVANTVLTTEGEDLSGNVGHAWLPDEGPYDSTFNAKGGCDAGKGATVRSGPTRISDGANYGFSDGHVKWFKPEAIFFPPRTSASRSHRLPDGTVLGPEPGGDMKGHAGTFHLR